MNVRRRVAVLAAVMMTALPTAGAAVADDAGPSGAPSATPALPAGLYGAGDPTYDGVFRQSYALLAQHTAGVRPAAEAVGWLAGQQCPNGGFAAYRSDPARSCTEKTPVDSNSTATAAQALAALGGHRDRVEKAVRWLRSVQNEDGGWGYTPGLPSDANSTGLAVGALAAAGQRPEGVRSAKDGKSPYDALPALALPCGKDGKGGAFGLRDAKSGKLAANADATAAGVLGGLGRTVVVGAGDSKAAGKDSGCRAAHGLTARQAAANGAAYLDGLLARTPYLVSSLPGAEDAPDYGNTADAVVALAAAGHGTTAHRSAEWLAGHAGGWAKQNGPAAWAQLVLAAHAAGTDPRHFGGTDLVAALNATGPAPASGPASAAGPERSGDRDGKGGSSSGTWWLVGVCLVAGIGGGLLLSTRTRRTP
ncbi:prenyltransferase/squalene oxidase repeat-containing protein [Streptomyces sp. TS71-3]|uniref:prenyltransferase/squalene oxidase repeat-containing protein n=1 Tax=Streptomyces sp. TS71-3 TaxID=2733862 RepID=UPI001B229E6C|nr:prenyltransferase/squalene oxidase repeat-containing protein [Streptomyces sp. TS71-3]GHJ37948.1 hypothetical protein Sm713_35570 [Streptomyces sp. TS71-3]